MAGATTRDANQNHDEVMGLTIPVRVPGGGWAPARRQRSSERLKPMTADQIVKFVFVSRRGCFEIVRRSNGWQTMFENERLDPETTPGQCAYNLANGLGAWPSFGSAEGLVPEDITDWTPVLRVER